MNNLRNKFIEEALKKVDIINNSTAILSVDITDIDQIENIFFALHMLKGTGAMYGFDTISEITNDFEKIYNDIRKDVLKFDKTILNLTIEIAKHIEKLIYDKDCKNWDLLIQHKRLIQKIAEIYIHMPTNTDLKFKF